jgi:hypothetical protein
MNWRVTLSDMLEHVNSQLFYQRTLKMHFNSAMEFKIV